jgi:DNA-binding XRE family transcriptional regulator
MTNNLDVLATAIRERRKALRLTQQDLADLCDVQRQTIGRLEAADPTVAVGTAMAVADTLGLEVLSEGGAS